MKIAMINSVSGYGSTGKLVAMLGKTEGVQSRIYYGRKHDSSGGDAVKISDDLGFLSHVVHTFVSDRHGFFNTVSTMKMVEDLKVFDPDLIHLHNLHGYYLDVNTLFSYLKSVHTPVIWTLHDCWAFTGHCAHYTSVGCEKWKTACIDCPALLHYPPTLNPAQTEKNRLLKKQLFTSPAADQMTIVTPSQWLKAEAEQSFLGKYRIKAIPNGIDHRIFHPVSSSFKEQHGIQDRFMILAAAGNWYKEKGTEDLKKLAHDLPEGCVLAVVGADRRFAASLAGPNVITVSRTERAEELAEIYSAADVFINLTKEDTFPTVNIEALSCGCPVITYAIGGSPEIITEKTGKSVPGEDLDALKEMIEDMQKGKVRFDRQDCEARGREFSRERMLGEYRALYDEMVNGVRK